MGMGAGGMRNFAVKCLAIFIGLIFMDVCSTLADYLWIAVGNGYTDMAITYLIGAIACLIASFSSVLLVFKLYKE